MITFDFLTPSEASHLVRRVKEKRLELNLSQQTLSAWSDVSLGVIKKFERTGKISLGSLLKLALVLGCLGDFTELFKAKPLEAARTLDELLKQKTRKRGRR